MNQEMNQIKGFTEMGTMKWNKLWNNAKRGGWGVDCLGIHTLFSIAFSIVIFSGVVFSIEPLLAQEGSETSSNAKTNIHDEVQQDANYLDLFVSRKKSQKYNHATKRHLRRLYVLVKNYGSKIPGSEEVFEDVKSIYKQALARFYRREYAASWSQNLKSIHGLYVNFAEQYKKRVENILADSSQKIVDMELSNILEPGQKHTRYIKETLRNTFKLHLAYNRTALAEYMEREKRPGDAIEYYRMAKLFAIQIIRDLEEEPELIKEIEQKYRSDVRDSRGLIIRKN